MRLIDAEPIEQALFKQADKSLAKNPYENAKICAFRRAFELIMNAPTIASLPSGAPSNDPLTPDELRKMGGEPYWHVGLQDDSPPPHWNILEPYYAEHIEDYGYGKRWLAFRRKPEEGDSIGS